MLGSAGHNDTLGRHGLRDKRANLGGETLLHLKPAREVIDYPCEFGKSYHLSLRYITYRYATEEWEYVMLAHAVEFYILDNYQF